MRLAKIISCTLCTAVLMLSIPGCGSSSIPNPVTEFPMPADDLLYSVLDEPDASLMLSNDGTYKIQTPYMDNNLELLYWEYIMTEDYFNTEKALNREMAATATVPEGGPDDPAITVPDYDEYEGVSFREYRKGIYENLKTYGVNDHFSGWTYKLTDRPSERLELIFEYGLRNYENPVVNERQIVGLYKMALQMINDDSEMREYVLNSVNLESYKDGSEARTIYIRAGEQDDCTFVISVYAESVRNRNGSGCFIKKTVSLEE